MITSSSTTTPSITIEPMPTKMRLPRVQPCSVTLCPTVTSSPMVSGKPSGLYGPAWVMCSTLPSWMLERAPMRMRCMSPRITVSGHTELSAPISTSPMTTAESSTNTRSPSVGVLFW